MKEKRDEEEYVEQWAEKKRGTHLAHAYSSIHSSPNLFMYFLYFIIIILWLIFCIEQLVHKILAVAVFFIYFGTALSK